MESTGIERKSREELPPITEKLIDVEGVIKSKNPGLTRFIPGFMISYLKRVIHEDFLNDFVWRNREEWGLDFIRRIMIEFKVDPQVIGFDNVPDAGRIIVMANHPLGGIDGVALMDIVGRKRKDILFPVNDILMNIPNMYELFIPINKHGSNADNVRIINATFESDVPILYFPAGLVSRKQNGKVEDLEWKKSSLTRAKRTKRDIIPCYIGGRNSNFFYNLANFRKSISLKANLEMLYLPDEMMKLKEKKFKVIFGKAIPYTTFDKRHSDQEWADILKTHVYRLAQDPNAEFGF